MITDQPANQTALAPRPRERAQTWWCVDCETWHTGSVLGGPIKHSDSERAISDAV